MFLIFKKAFNNNNTTFLIDNALKQPQFFEKISKVRAITFMFINL
jgi:hypothetical protein